MEVIQVTPQTPAYQKLFLQLPFKIYQNTPQWVPPLAADTKSLLDGNRHTFYQYGKAAFFLAIDPQNGPLGRIAVLNNTRYNEFNHEQTAFFYLYESINDTEVSSNLFHEACAWAKANGLQKIIGPKGFTTLDGMGLLVKGFEHRPAFGLPYNLPYYPQLVEASGFSAGGDMVSGYLNSNSFQMPAQVAEVADLIQKRRGIRVITFKNRREFAKIIPSLQKMYNAALEGTTGNMPMTEADIKALADQLLWFADYRLIKIIMKDEEPIGFLIAYPDISAAVQRCKGQLFPFGWLDCLLEIRRTKWVNINGAAIVEKHRGLGGTALLFNEMHKSIMKGGFIHADLVQIGTDNEKMQLELRNLGIEFYKVHRLYQRNIE
jgi:hypothetical protein